MAIRILFFLSFVLFFSNVKAAQIKTVSDDTMYCPPVGETQFVAPKSGFHAKLNGNSVKISLVTCDKGNWVLHKGTKGLPVEKYVTQSGKKVEIFYSDFRLVVSTLDWSKNKFIGLPNFEKTAAANLKLCDLGIGAKTVDLSLLARAKVFVDGVPFDEFDSKWNDLRLTF